MATGESTAGGRTGSNRNALPGIERTRTWQPQYSVVTRNLRVGYGKTTVLSGVSIAPSGVLGILGAPGAGKSTLLRAIGGGRRQIPGLWRQGTIEIPRGRHVEFLDQCGRLPDCTISEFLDANCAARSPETRHAGAARLLCKAGLSHLVTHLDTGVDELSPAQQRMLMIARLLEADPVCVLLDEPFTDVCPSEAEPLHRFVRGLRGQTTVLLATRDREHARAVCTEICLLADQTIAEVTPAAEFFDSPSSDRGRKFLNSGGEY